MYALQTGIHSVCHIPSQYKAYRVRTWTFKIVLVLCFRAEITYAKFSVMLVKGKAMDCRKAEELSSRWMGGHHIEGRASEL